MRAGHGQQPEAQLERLPGSEVHATKTQSTNLGLPIVMSDSSDLQGNRDEHVQTVRGTLGKGRTPFRIRQWF